MPSSYVTEKRHQTKVTKFLHFGSPPIKIFGYTSECDTIYFSLQVNLSYLVTVLIEPIGVVTQLWL